MSPTMRQEPIPTSRRPSNAWQEPGLAPHLSEPQRLAHEVLPPDVSDTLDRRLRDLRVSVTDRCNFRCTYCMPKEVFGRDYRFLPRDSLLTFEEITRLARIFIDHGVGKIRITGGEPLLRRDVERLIEMIAGLDGLRDLTLTTNGALLARKARALKDAGLQRVTVSLDALDDAVFGSLNDVDYPVEQVLEGIEAARAAGFSPIKINMVVKRGANEDSVLDMARYFHGTDIILRFIEYMDVGNTNGWRLDDVVPAAEILEMVDAEMPLELVDPNYRGEVARRYRYKDGGGEVGVIASVTEPFCGDCTRARLSADGILYTCLFAAAGHDFRALLRQGRCDEEISEFFRATWTSRKDRYSEIRTSETVLWPKIEMFNVGG